MALKIATEMTVKNFSQEIGTHLSAPQENTIPAELLRDKQNNSMFTSCVTCIYITFAFRWLIGHLARHSKATS